MLVEEMKDSREWEIFLKSRSEGTFFHSLKWRDVIQKSFRYASLYVTIRDADGTLVGICPGFILRSTRMNIYHSVPESDYGGPIIAEHCVRQASVALKNFLEGLCANKGVVCAKLCLLNDNVKKFFTSPLGYTEKTRGVVEIDLKVTPSNFIWNKALSKNRRWQIRRIERDGFQAREARSILDLRDFYNLYYSNLKYVASSPYPHAISPYPHEFMENIWKVLYPHNLRIWLVEREKTIAGAVFFKYGPKTYFVYAGISREKEYNRYSVIPYLMWKEIETAEQEGYRYISLGGTPGDPKNPYHLQKTRLGGKFYQQETVWYPVGSIGRILLQTRTRTVSVWKTVREFLPITFRRILEGRLSSI